MSVYAAGKEPPCPSKLPGCLGVIKERSAKQCANCYDFARKHQLGKSEKERLRLEDRLIAATVDHLKRVGREIPMLAPAKVNKQHPTTHEMVLLLSDAHFSEVVDPEVAMGICYNEDIAKRRIERVRDVTLRYKQLRETSYPIRKLTVAVLGDMLNGDIHEELEITNESPLPVALVTLAYYLNDMGLSLRQEFPDVEFVFIPGNHPRTKKVPRFKQKTTTNWEYVLGHMVKALAGTRYTVTVPKAMVYVHHIFGWRMGMSHGDAVKSNSFAGIPFYGLKQRNDALQSLMRHLDQPGLDYITIGHFHKPTVLEGTDCTLIINGSVKGGDEYSLGNYLSSNDPVQYLLTFHEKHGLTDYSRINLKGIN
jgi:predicted phosphodiesterase